MFSQLLKQSREFLQLQIIELHLQTRCDCFLKKCIFGMSELLDKSALNMNAAEYLLKEGHYDSVCHPAYYSCFQLMKHKVCHSMHIDYEAQEREIVSSRQNTHQYTIRKITDYIQQQKGAWVAQQFNRDIKDLKKHRENSDYKIIRLGRDTCEACVTLAKHIYLTISRTL